MTASDMDLVRDYARNHSEAAFATLVSRHANLVYSVALRQVRDSHRAEEIAQAVFVILAKKAGSLSSKTVVSAWLCQTARYVAAKALTADRRRQDREYEAYMQSALKEDVTAWAELEPVLDSAMQQLSRRDHDALVVRYFESRNFKDVASLIGTTEAGAKMRVNRALEKLRGILAKRGITLSIAVLASAMSANSVQAAPAGFAGAATLAALKGTAVTSSSLELINTTLTYMAWTKMKAAALAGAVALLTVGTVTVALQSHTNNNSQPQTVAGTPTASYATPEATLKTLIAAMNASDYERFAEGCTPERAQIFRSQNAGKTDDQMEREMSGMAKALRSYKILETRKTSDTEMILHVKPTGDTSQAPPGDLAAMRMRMRKVGSDWKFDGHEGR